MEAVDGEEKEGGGREGVFSVGGGFSFFFSVVVFGNVEWLGNVFIFGKFIVGFGFSWGVSSLLTRSSCFCEGIAFSQPFGNGA